VTGALVHRLAAGLVCLLAACAPNRAPVVERPVQDARPDPLRARSASTPAGTPVPAKKAPSAAAASARPSPASAGDQEDWRPEQYTVRQGDTLYGIALDHGQDYRDLAQWNGLENPNVIRIGQILRVKAPAGWSERPDPEDADIRPMQVDGPIQAAPLEPVAPPPLISSPKAIKRPYTEQALAEMRGLPYTPPAPPKPAPAHAPVTAGPGKPSGTPAGPAAAPAAAAGSPAPVAPAPASASTAGAAKPAVAAARPPAALPSAAPAPGAWAWPVRGRLLHPFNSGTNPKGIAIAADAGTPVIASAPGKVVYSGSGLRGYGKLVIVKHDPNYLSVYAHNRELFVKEGERVGKGQKIAEVGDSGADRVALHFEIRKLGKPVDPLQYLAPL